jgi:hypothetical protein
LKQDGRMRRWIAAMVVLAACRPPGYDRGNSPDAARTTDAHPHDGTPATGDAATADSPPGVCNQAFRLDGHAGASSVLLTGDFIAWGGDLQHGATALSLDTSTGVWSGTRQFTAGVYQYKFIVDGTQWIVDPGNPNQVDDGFGGKNSLYTCVP